MTVERKDVLKLGPNYATILGEDVVVGQTAPDFTVRDDGFAPVTLANSTGKVRIIGSIPSVDTSVCHIETLEFNKRAADLSDDVEILIISMDMPFALKRWCGAEGVDAVQTLSDAYDGNFGESYGVMIKENRFHRRAIWVVDRNDQVVYSDYMASLGDQPDYDAVLAAAKTAL